MSNGEDWAIAECRIAAEMDARTGALDLYGLAIGRLPPSIAELDWLVELNCSATQVSNLGSVAGLYALQSLDCSSTQVSDLTPVATLSALQTLDCSYTQVSDLAPVAALAALQSLHCSSTQVSDLAPVAALSALQSLHCYDTQVSDLAPVAELSALQTLDCSYTQVSDLAPVAALSALRSLSCSGTQVSDLAPVTVHFALQSLYCGNTQVSDLAPVAALAALQSLDCSGTQVSDLTPVATLSALQSLYCSETQVSDLAPVAALAALRKLDCGRSKVSDLSPLVSLGALEKLGANYLHLPDAHEALWNLPGLEHVSLIGTTLGTVPEAVCGFDCLERLRDYFRSREAGVVPLRSARLFILGNGGVGKTQIGRQLRGLPFEDWHKTTHGIDVHRITLDGGKGGPIALRLWDFGGQPLYHGTHALFLRGQSLYLLVWAERHETGLCPDGLGQDHANMPLPYWIAMARQASEGQCAVLIVQTRVDEDGTASPAPPVGGDPLDWCVRRYVLDVSASVPRGFDALRARITAAADALLDKGGYREISVDWVRVIAALDRIRPDDGAQTVRQRELPAGKARSLTRAAFEDLCRAEGVKHGFETLLFYLNATGEVLHRPGLLRGEVIIDQNWALDAVYTLFERQRCVRLLQEKRGRFRAADLGHWLWDAEGFSPDEQALFLSYMESCGLCFELFRDEGEPVYLAPAGLPDDEGEIARKRSWDAEWAGLAPLAYAFDLLHDGIIHRLIFALGRELRLEAEYWRHGVLVFDPVSRARLRLRCERGEGWNGTVLLEAQHPPELTPYPAMQLLAAMQRLVERELEAIGVPVRLAPVGGYGSGGIEPEGLGRMLAVRQLPPPEDERRRQRRSRAEQIAGLERDFCALRDAQRDMLLLRLNIERSRLPDGPHWLEDLCAAIIRWAVDEDALDEMREEIERARLR